MARCALDNMSPVVASSRPLISWRTVGSQGQDFRSLFKPSNGCEEKVIVSDCCEEEVVERFCACVEHSEGPAERKDQSQSMLQIASRELRVSSEGEIFHSADMARVAAQCGLQVQP